MWWLKVLSRLIILQRRFSNVWWMQVMWAVGCSSASTTTPARSADYTTSAWRSSTTLANLTPGMILPASLMYLNHNVHNMYTIMLFNTWSELDWHLAFHWDLQHLVIESWQFARYVLIIRHTWAEISLDGILSLTACANDSGSMNELCITAGKIVHQRCAEMHGPWTSPQVQLRQPQVSGRERDGVPSCSAECYVKHNLCSAVREKRQCHGGRWSTSRTYFLKGGVLQYRGVRYWQIFLIYWYFLGFCQ